MEETTESSYVNEFLICSSKFEKKREGYTAATKRHKFLYQIKYDDYDVVKQKLQGDTSINFDTCVKRIRSRKQDMSTDEKTEEKGRAQIFVRKGEKFQFQQDRQFQKKVRRTGRKYPINPGIYPV